jgi:hypothetical protein
MLRGGHGLFDGSHNLSCFPQDFVKKKSSAYK